MKPEREKLIATLKQCNVILLWIIRSIEESGVTNQSIKIEEAQIRLRIVFHIFLKIQIQVGSAETNKNTDNCSPHSRQIRPNLMVLSLVLSEEETVLIKYVSTKKNSFNYCVLLLNYVSSKYY